MHTCALLTNGAVRCWGRNTSGQLGYGHTTTLGDDESVSTLTDVIIGGPASAIAAGGDHTCVIMQSNSAVRCWGSNSVGELGYGNTNAIGDNELPSSAGDVSVGGPVSRIAVGGAHTCVRMTTNNAVRCWGLGAAGRLGYGNTNTIGDNELPSSAGDVNVGGPVSEIVAGFAPNPNVGHTCALLQSGAVRCWGAGANGRLGYVNTANVGDVSAPNLSGDVNVGGTVTAVSTGNSHTCAVLSTGVVRCWGLGLHGRLGTVNTADVGDNETPASVPGVTIMSTSFALTVSTTGNGVVNSNPAGISQCGGTTPDCTEIYVSGTSVALTATPGSGATFLGWSGNCSTVQATTTVVMDQPRSCTANFSGTTSGTMPAFVAAGAGVSSSGNLNVPYPAPIAAGQLLVLQVGMRQGNAVTTPTGWTLGFSDQGTSNPRQSVFFTFAAGGEAGALPVALAAGAVNTGRMYSFSGVRSTSFHEGDVVGNGTNGVLTGPTLTTTGSNRLGVCLVAIDNNPLMGAFVGASGGTWMEPVQEFPDNVSNNFGLQIQTVSLPNAGLLSGGSANFGMGGDDSIFRAFALIGN
jgi:hypothetical protein